MKGQRVTLDGLTHGTLWPDGEFEVVSDPFGLSGRDKAPYEGKGFVRVRPVDDRWDGGFLVVPVVHTEEVT